MNKRKRFSFLFVTILLINMFGYFTEAETLSYQYDINNLFDVSSMPSSEKVKLNEKRVILPVGYTYVLALQNGSRKISWRSSNKKVASIKMKRKNAVLIHGNKAGKAVITAKYKKKKYRCRVTVVDQKADIISGSNCIISLAMGQTVPRSNTLNLTAAYPCDISIEPADPNLITIETQTKWNGKWGSVYVTALPKLIEDINYGIVYDDYFYRGFMQIKTISTSVIVKNSLNPEEVDILPVDAVLFNHFADS